MTAYRWTHDASRKSLDLDHPIDPVDEDLSITDDRDSLVGGSYQLGIGETEVEVVYLDVSRSSPPLYRALRGQWGTPARSHFAGTPLVPARRVYTDF